MALGAYAERYKQLLLSLVEEKEEVLRNAARQSLRGLTDANPSVATDNRPAADDIESWLQVAEKPGDAEAGRRVFFSPTGAYCARCHTLAGRGASLGPDLTQIGRTQSRRRLLESILQPSREVAPHYQTWVMETTNGKTHTGVSVGKLDNDRKERFSDTEGKVFVLSLEDIVSRTASPTSVMPQGLEKTMTLQEVRDLLTFLMTSR